VSKRPDNGVSPIRRISKDEKDLRRQWPDKKQLASSHNTPLPKPGEKNRIHSVLVALPVIMLIIGLVVYFKGESAQNNGTPILSELVVREGQFKSVSQVSGIGRAKFYLWYITDGRAKGVRVSFSQKQKLSELEKGDALSLEIAPSVVGSNVLWAYRISHDGNELIGPTE